jgi:DNA-binding transcriptional MerR regulator
MAGGLRIGEVARRTRLRIDAIRYYQKRGLVPNPARTRGGFRIFGGREIRMLEFIRDAQKLGFTLREIHELLALRAGNDHSCERMRDLLAQKLSEVRRKIRELRELENELSIDLERCERKLRRGSSRERSCPVLLQIGSSGGM